MTTAMHSPDRALTDNQRRMSLLLVGAAAIFFPLVYLVSDLVEVAQGDFTTFRLTLTYVGEAGFPLFVIGLCTLLRDRLPWWGLMGGIACAYSFVFFTSTVVWAIVAHGAVMVVGGIALGLGIAGGNALPARSGYALATGVVLVASASGMGNLERTLAAAGPDIAFIGMGKALVRGVRGSTSSDQPDRVLAAPDQSLQSISGNVVLDDGNAVDLSQQPREGTALHRPRSWRPTA